jgi:holin-like protein
VIGQLALIMGFQLAGEALVAAAEIPFPRPLCGMLLLLGWLCIGGGASEDLSRTAGTLVDHLGLLFVPAGAAIVGFGTLIARDGLAIAGALVVSTALAIVVAGRAGRSSLQNGQGNPD